MSITEIKSVVRGEQDIGKTLETLAGAAGNIGTDMTIGTLLAAGLCPKKGIKRFIGSVGILMLSMKVGEVAENYFHEWIRDMKEAFGVAKKELAEAAKEVEEKAEENKE